MRYGYIVAKYARTYSEEEVAELRERARAAERKLGESIHALRVALDHFEGRIPARVAEHAVRRALEGEER